MWLTPPPQVLGQLLRKFLESQYVLKGNFWRGNWETVHHIVIICTEGALRLPTTYDNHLIPSSPTNDYDQPNLKQTMQNAYRST